MLYTTLRFIYVAERSARAVLIGLRFDHIDKKALEIALFCCLFFMLYYLLKLIDGVFNHLMPTLFELINRKHPA